jgi:glycosyltransferase involved in cell wall biosynthesis
VNVCPVTVIIPSYNHSAFIGEAIESVLDQTLKPAEIIVVDDNSIDNSLQIITKYEKHINLLKHKKNLGGASALNSGLKNSTQEYIAILNSDDVWVRTKLAIQYDFMIEHNHPLSFTTAQIIDSESQVIQNPDRIYDVFKIVKPYQESYLNHFFTLGNFLCHPTLFAERRIFVESGEYDNRLVQLPDFNQWIKFAKKYQIRIIDQALTQYRYVPGINTSDQSSTRTRTVSRNELFFIFDSFFDEISNEQLVTEFKNQIASFTDDTKKVAKFDLGAALLLSQQNGALKSQSTMAAMNRLWDCPGVENEKFFKDLVSNTMISCEAQYDHDQPKSLSPFIDKMKFMISRFSN